MEFIRVAPQVVEHKSGYRVFTLDRERIAYEDANNFVTVDVEFGEVVSIYVGSLSMIRTDNTIGEGELLAQISEGIRALGKSVEVVLPDSE